MQSLLPTIVLAGSDPQPPRLPDGVRDQHPLSGYKSAAVAIGGRPMIQVVLERLANAGCCGPLYIAGPQRVYAELAGPATVIDTDGSFGQNIRAAIHAVRKSQPGRPMVFVTCDILPEVRTLKALFADYARRSPCDLWFPLVRAPEQPERLGASAWKPAYRIIPEPGDTPTGILPGHLVVADTAALRLPFLYRLFDLGYRTRNRPIDRRRGVMVRGILAGMLYQDLLHLLSLRMPNLTWSILRAGLPAVRKLRDGELTRRELEEAIRTIFVKHAHRRRFPERRVETPFVDALSLARDIDTVEEARELGANFRS